MEDPIEWVTIVNGDEVTVSVTVPRLPGETDADYEARRDRIIEQMKEDYPPVER